MKSTNPNASIIMFSYDDMLRNRLLDAGTKPHVVYSDKFVEVDVLQVEMGSRFILVEYVAKSPQ